jgi:hypothetical protein
MSANDSPTALTGVAVSPPLVSNIGRLRRGTPSGAGPHLRSALLHHRDKRVTEEHHNRASSLSAANNFGRLIRQQSGPARPGWSAWGNEVAETI